MQRIAGGHYAPTNSSREARSSTSYHRAKIDWTILGSNSSLSLNNDLMVMLNSKLSAPLAKAAAKKTKPAAPAVELEITLLRIKPRIWRNFVVPAGIKLNRLHDVIQTVMGWTDSHLHSFRVGNYEYLQSDPDDADWQQTMSDRIVHDERKHTLRDLIRAEGDKFTYTYDFGDDWEHEVKVKSILPSEEPLKSAFCNVGERACPPEDCGGFPGYEELAEALPNPKHPQHRHWANWIGEFDPSLFDCDDVNRRLRGIRV